MLKFHVVRENGKIVRAAPTTESFEVDANTKVSEESRNDWKTFEEANAVALAANFAQYKAGENEKVFIATDSGPNVCPRYDVIELPMVGDDVSYTFNGDYYPCGKIVKVTGKNFRKIVTRDENKVERTFWRRRLTGAWIYDGSWVLVKGHIKRLNLEF